MAIIEVNHRTLREIASAITTYCTTQDKEMRLADTEIQSMLISDWLGSDAREFRIKWVAVDSHNSQTVILRESLKSFGESLTACANEYENAQAASYNAANWLPKYLCW